MYREKKKSDYKRKVEKEKIDQKWEDAQLKAASAQSVLDYMVKTYEEHKEELPLDIVEKTEEQISIRKKEIEDFLMSAKDDYDKAIKDFYYYNSTQEELSETIPQ